MPDVSQELLARHDGWLRALVRGLVADGHSEDVLQEVWGQAWSQGPRDYAALPAWLATVARRIAGRMRRTEQRRRHYEQQAVAGGELVQADAADLVVRVEERQRVAQAVLELDEPFRSVVLLRYFEDLSPEQIAVRLAVPSATVRSRLHRAQERLRGRFERERGPAWRGQLALLCMPLVGSGETGKPVLAGAAKALFFAALLPLVLVAVWWWAQGALVAPMPSAGARSTESAQTPAPEPGTAAVLVDGGERIVAALVAAEDALSETHRVAGEVLDYTGRPKADMEIWFVPGRSRKLLAASSNAALVGASDASGRFDVRVPKEAGTLHVGPEFATLRAWSLAGRATEDGTEDALLVMAGLVQLAGEVVAENGSPVAHQSVEVRIQDTFGLPVVATGSDLVRHNIKTTTDSSGHFVLADVPAFPFGEIGVGIAGTMIPIPANDRYDLRLVVTSRFSRPRRPAPSQVRSEPSDTWFAIEGTVCSPDLEPIEGACVRVARTDDLAETNADGAFRCTGRAAPNQPALLWCAAPGYAPTQLQVWPEPEGAVTRVAARMVPLASAAASFAIAGVVADPEGVAVAGLQVALADATPLQVGGLRWGYVEAVQPHEFGAHDTTAEDGSFRITGVLDRSYHLRVFDAASGFAQTFGPFDPRESCRLQVPKERVRHQFAVRVVSSEAQPLAGVGVRIAVVALHVESDSGFGSQYSTLFLGQELFGETDDDGVCRFVDVPGGDLQISIVKPGHVKEVLQVGAEAARDQAVVPLLRLMPFRVAAQGLEDKPWLSLKLFGLSGEELEVRPAWRGQHYPTSWQWSCYRGQSVVIAMPESVRRAELRDLHSGELLRSMPVVLNQSGVTVLEFPE